MHSTAASVIFRCSQIALLAFAPICYAGPQIVGVAGDVTHGGQLRISGSGFGVKVPARPLLWAPFDGSAQPSSLGIVTGWEYFKDLSFAAGEGYAGTGGLKASSGEGNWTAAVRSVGFAWNDYRQEMYLFRRFKQNFSVTSDLNWKHFRVWSDNFAYPNWYIQTGNGNVGIEGGNDDARYPYEVIPGALAAVRGTPNQWTTEEILVKANSAAGSRDGEFYHYVQGFGLAGRIPYQTYATKSFVIRMSNDQSPMVLAFPVHGVKANTSFPSEYRYWVDDVYLDSTWARVMVGNSPEFSKCTRLEIQIPIEWSADKLTVSVNLQSYPSDQPRYLFVIDSDGVASSGYPLGGTNLPNPPSGVVVD